MQFKIEHRVGAATSSKAIWDVLSDLKRWPEWNSLYPEVAGLLRIQQRLTIREVFPAQPPRTIAPMVYDWVPNAQIIWIHSELGGLVKRIRYIEIESLNDEDTNCILSNGEIWQGLLGPTIGKRRRRALRAGFEKLNHDIVARLNAVAAGEAIADGDRG
jgi:hypothetical protein